MKLNKKENKMKTKSGQNANKTLNALQLLDFICIFTADFYF